MEAPVLIGLGSDSLRQRNRSSGGVLWCLAPRCWRQILLARRACEDQTCSIMFNGGSIRMGSGKCWGWFDALSSLSCSFSNFWADFVLWQGALSYRGGHCHLGVPLPWGEVLFSSVRVVDTCEVASTWMPESQGFPAENCIVTRI